MRCTSVIPLWISFLVVSTIYLCNVLRKYWLDIQVALSQSKLYMMQKGLLGPILKFCVPVNSIVQPVFLQNKVLKWFIPVLNGELNVKPGIFTT